MAKGWLPSKNVIDACEHVMNSILEEREELKQQYINKLYDSDDKDNTHHILVHRWYWNNSYGSKKTLEELSLEYDESAKFYSTRSWWNNKKYETQYDLCKQIINLAKNVDTILISHEDFNWFGHAYKE